MYDKLATQKQISYFLALFPKYYAKYAEEMDDIYASDHKFSIVMDVKLSLDANQHVKLYIMSQAISFMKDYLY